MVNISTVGGRDLPKGCANREEMRWIAASVVKSLCCLVVFGLSGRETSILESEGFIQTCGYMTGVRFGG